VRAFAARISFGDLPLLIYFIAFVREYFWILPNNYIAWPLTACVSLGLWYWYIRMRPGQADHVHPSFWLIVGLPLLFLFSTRIAYPDLSFDVLTYHIVHSERALSGALYIPGDFFFAQFPSIDPASDMITGITRHVLGFRAGVVINLIALLWLGTVMDRILRLYISSGWIRSLLLLACVSSEFLLAEINNYMVDLLALPLLMEMLWIGIRPANDDRPPAADLSFFMLLGGMAVALKITNIVFVTPLLIFYAFRLWRVHGWPTLKNDSALARSAIFFIAPILPYVIYITYRTGSPVFPLYNKVFRSPLLGQVNIYDGRWGPRGLLETLIWPIKIFFVPDRLSELNMYSGRIGLGCLAAVAGLLIGRKDWRLGGLCFTMLVGSFLWSEGSGYIRYGLFLEPLGALVIVLLIVSLVTGRGGRRSIVAYPLAALLGVALVVQCYRGAVLSYDHEWSGRPNCYRQRGCRDGLAHLFRDRELPLNDDLRNRLAGVDVWVESTLKTGSIMTLAKPEVPGIGVVEEYYRGTGSQEEFRHSLELMRGKRFFSLVFRDDVADAKHWLASKRFAIKNIDEVDVPFFSTTDTLAMSLIELEPPRPQDQ